MTTNRDFLVNVLRHPEFLAGEADTGFLERHDCSRAAGRRPRALAAAAARARRPGRAPRRARACSARCRAAGATTRRSCRPSRYERRRGRLPLRPPRPPRRARGRRRAARRRACTLRRPTEVDLEVDGVRRAYARRRRRRQHRRRPGRPASSCPRFTDPTAEAAAGSLISPMPGTVLRVCVAQGDDGRGAPAAARARGDEDGARDRRARRRHRHRAARRRGRAGRGRRACSP